MDAGELRALDRAASVIGDRWSLLVVGALQEGPLRYGELQGAIPAISTNVLAQRLAALEAAGLVLAEPYSLRPVRMRYALTADGRALFGALAALSAWGEEREDDEADEMTLRHAVCGTPLQLRWYCATCEEDLDLEAGRFPAAQVGETFAA